MRISGIKEEYGTLCCLKSHHKCMEYADLYKNNYNWFLILEDDAVLNLPKYSVKEIIETMNKVDKIYLKETPLVMLDSHINGDNPSYHNSFKNVRITNGACNTTHAYIIRNDYANVLRTEWDKSIPLFYQEIENSKKTKRIPNWQYEADSQIWMDLQKKDKWFLLDSLIIQDNSSGYESTIIKTILPFKEKYNIPTNLKTGYGV